MFELVETDNFRKWLDRLKDETARGLIVSRLARLAYGHAGDNGCQRRDIAAAQNLARSWSV